MTHTRYRVEAAGEPRPFPPEAMARIEGILKRYPTKQAALLPVLWVAQETFGWISKESAEEVARILGLPPSHVDGVLTFYTMYNLRPVGRNLLQVCTSISCHLAGAEGLVDRCRSGSASASRRPRRTASSRWSRSSASPDATARRR